MTKEDHELFEGYYCAYFSKLFNFALKHTGDEQFAFDAVQDVFVIAMSKSREFFESASPSGWLFKTLRNVIGNEYQRRSRRATEPLDENIVIVVEDTASVIEWLPSDLSDADELIIIMRFQLCCTYKDISQAFRLNVPAVRKRLSRAIERCRNSLSA